MGAGLIVSAGLGEELPAYLAPKIPLLANRGGEALRALVAGCILDHNDIATLAVPIGGLKRVPAHAADASQDPLSPSLFDGPF